MKLWNKCQEVDKIFHRKLYTVYHSSVLRSVIKMCWKNISKSKCVIKSTAFFSNSWKFKTLKSSSSSGLVYMLFTFSCISFTFYYSTLLNTNWYWYRDYHRSGMYKGFGIIIFRSHLSSFTDNANFFPI